MNSPRRARRKINVVDRLHKYILRSSDGCWLWTGYLQPHNGYGQINVNGRARRAHRVTYEAFVGPIPDGLIVMHRCDVPRCVNPDHLQLGTQLENLQDMRRKGRARYTTDGPNRRGHHNKVKTHCKWGHEYTPENTGRHPKAGGRFCIACAKEAKRRYQAKKAPRFHKAI